MIASPLCLSSNAVEIQIFADEVSNFVPAPPVDPSDTVLQRKLVISKIHSVWPSIFSDVGGQVITVVGSNFLANGSDIWIGKLKVTTQRLSSTSLEFVAPVLSVGNHTLTLVGELSNAARVHVMPFFNSIDFSPKHIRNDEYHMISISFSAPWSAIVAIESDIACQICGIPAIAVMFEGELKCIVPLDVRSSCSVSVNVAGIHLFANSMLNVRSTSPVLLSVLSSSCSEDLSVSVTLVGLNFDPSTVFRVFSPQMSTLLSKSQLVDQQTAVVHFLSMKIDRP
jgi:hypothetical protein